MKTLKLTDAQHKSLIKYMEEVDFCFLCENHLSNHSANCPLWEPDAVEEMQIAIDNDVIDLDDL